MAAMEAATLRRNGTRREEPTIAVTSFADCGQPAKTGAFGPSSGRTEIDAGDEDILIRLCPRVAGVGPSGHNRAAL